MLESFETRSSEVLKFLKLLNKDLDIRIFELNDPVGIAGTEEKMTACILTRETEKGGNMINEARVKNGFPPLEIVFAEMVLAEVIEGGEDQFSNKVSSTFIRKFIAEN